MSLAKTRLWLNMELLRGPMVAESLLRRACRGKPFEALIQRRGRDANHVTHHLTLATETTIRRLAF